MSERKCTPNPNIDPNRVCWKKPHEADCNCSMCTNEECQWCRCSECGHVWKPYHSWHSSASGNAPCHAGVDLYEKRREGYFIWKYDNWPGYLAGEGRMGYNDLAYIFRYASSFKPIFSFYTEANIIIAKRIVTDAFTLDQERLRAIQLINNGATKQLSELSIQFPIHKYQQTYTQ